jgi:hypothetical protein
MALRFAWGKILVMNDRPRQEYPVVVIHLRRCAFHASGFQLPLHISGNFNQVVLT